MITREDIERLVLLTRSGRIKLGPITGRFASEKGIAAVVKLLGDFGIDTAGEWRDVQKRLAEWSPTFVVVADDEIYENPEEADDPQLPDDEQVVQVIG